jgi:ABC-type lipoprotein export system ATPase subunit
MTDAATGRGDSPVLTATALSRRLGGRDVVAGVELTIGRGELIAVMGPSGCGKTTLLQMLGLLDRPDAGTIALDGRDPWRGSNGQRAELRLRSIGFVFQQSNLIEHLTARDNVALPAWRASGSRASALADADRLLERIGLAHRARARASELSIGEAQRAAVARALINRPRLVLADEPTGSLDVEAAERVMAALFAPAGAAVLVATHDPEVATRAGRIMRMRDGRLQP